MRLIASPIAVVAAALAPASAEARVVMERLAPCYVSAGAGQSEVVDVRGRGFAPGAAVMVELDGAAAGTVFADAAGQVATRLVAPDPGRGERGFRVELRDRDRPGRKAHRRARVAMLEAKLTPAVAAPQRRVRWRGRGFTAGGPVYAHYAGPRGERRTVSLTRPRGACGRFSARRSQFPFRPSVGTWTVQLDQQASYSPSPATPFVRVPIEVRRAG